ncbi:hypothetical protein DFJ74DRAFT_769489 [Hyaloraphidium curvatum]|nr:hypothetical protein DFJ74DRAFT_769489 [Hyaloraphidium curvatum]
MEDEQEVHILYASRPEWSDLSPIPVPEPTPNPPVSIAYAPEYADAMGYFRALCAKGEISERGLELTGTILSWNPAHYTVWKYRQDALWELGKNLWDELDFVDQMAAEHPKSYQIWHHRQLVADKLGDPVRERPFINSLLMEDDAKNYHAWSYRQWVVRRFNAWKDEMADMDALIRTDVRNNSAWNHRFFVLKCAPEGPWKADAHKESLYAMENILVAPANESPWQYLRGVLSLGSGGSAIDFSDCPHVLQFCFDLVAKGTVSRPLYLFLADYYESQAAAGVADALSNCTAMLTALRDEIDPVRVNYWNWRLSLLGSLQQGA